MPAADRRHFLLFADHSLSEYPEVAAAVGELAASGEAAVAVVTQREAALTVAVLQTFDVDLPVVQTRPGGYWDFNVRVMPFATVLAPDGTVLATGVVSTPERATLWILVCRARCASAPPGLDRSVPIDGRYLRQFSTLGNNIAIFITDNDRRSGRELQASVQHVVNDLDVAYDSGSCCYIQ